MSEPVHHDGRADVVAFMAENLGPEVVTVHIANHPVITVDGNRATGSWVFEDTVIATVFGVLIRGGGYYTRPLPQGCRRPVADRGDPLRPDLRVDDVAERHPQLPTHREHVGSGAEGLSPSRRETSFVRGATARLSVSNRNCPLAVSRALPRRDTGSREGYGPG